MKISSVSDQIQARLSKIVNKMCTSTPWISYLYIYIYIYIYSHRDISSSSSPSAKIVTHGKDNTSCTNAFMCVDTMDLEHIAASA